MKHESERTWHPKINGRYLVRITKTQDGMFVSSLLPVATRDDDARRMTRRERFRWRLLRRPSKGHLIRAGLCRGRAAGTPRTLRPLGTLLPRRALRAEMPCEASGTEPRHLPHGNSARVRRMPAHRVRRASPHGGNGRRAELAWPRYVGDAVPSLTRLGQSGFTSSRSSPGPHGAQADQHGHGERGASCPAGVSTEEGRPTFRGRRRCDRLGGLRTT